MTPPWIFEPRNEVTALSRWAAWAGSRGRDSDHYNPFPAARQAQWARHGLLRVRLFHCETEGRPARGALLVSKRRVADHDAAVERQPRTSEAVARRPGHVAITVQPIRPLLTSILAMRGPDDSCGVLQSAYRVRARQAQGLYRKISAKKCCSWTICGICPLAAMAISPTNMEYIGSSKGRKSRKFRESTASNSLQGCSVLIPDWFHVPGSAS